MPDPIARKRLKKKMLDRWENEGGRIASDRISADETKPTSKNNSQLKKLSSPRGRSTGGGAASPTKSRKPIRE